MIGSRIVKPYSFYSDAVVRRTIARVDTWLAWLSTNNVKGFIGETGWPCYPDPYYGQWENVAVAYYNHLRNYNVDIGTWAADGKQRPSTNKLQQYGRSESNNVQGLAFATNATNIPLLYNKSGIFTNYHSQYIGNSVLSDGTLFSNVNPGTFGTSNTDCIYPSNADLSFLASRGVKTFRMSFRWERLYTTLNGALDATELSRLVSVLNAANSFGMKVIPCPFSFASYWLGTDATHHTEYKLTTDTAATVNINHFTDFWGKFSMALHGNVGIYAYDLMNEPQGMNAITGPHGSNLQSNPGFESGISGWASPASTTIAQSSAQARTGSFSLSITAASSGTIQAWSPTVSGVTVGQGYYIEAYVRANTVVRAWHLQIDWKTSGGAIVSSTAGTAVSNTTAGWTKITVAGNAPATCVKFNFDIIGVSAVNGEVHYADDVTVQLSDNVTPEQQWEQMSQAALNAIRANSDTTLVMIPGYGYSAVRTWSTYHPVAWITDSANNFKYEAHHYWNTNGDGSTIVSYPQEVIDAVAAGY